MLGCVTVQKAIQGAHATHGPQAYCQIVSEERCKLVRDRREGGREGSEREVMKGGGRKGGRENGECEGRKEKWDERRREGW